MFSFKKKARFRILILAFQGFHEAKKCPIVVVLVTQVYLLWTYVELLRSVTLDTWAYLGLLKNQI